ncbi:hypothetical protein ABFS83_02G120600 [Erythranthe nasuta]
MSSYMSKLFPRSNSSFFLRSGNALEAKVVRLREEMYLVDAGIGRPSIANKQELIKPPKSTEPATFSSRVGFLTPSNRETPVKNVVLQRCFVDLVTGDPRTKQQAATRFDDIIGQNDAAASGGEQPLLLPQRFRKQRAWVELKNTWRSNSKVKGFVIEKVRGGYAVAVAGQIAFLPARQVHGKITSDRFIIESITPKNFVVAKA